MDEPKRNRAEQRAHDELLIRLADQERAMRALFESGHRPPPIDAGPGSGPEREIELDLDADVVKWFRALGPVHAARINAALRAYARERWKDAEEG